MLFPLFYCEKSEIKKVELPKLKQTNKKPIAFPDSKSCVQLASLYNNTYTH